MPMKKPIVVAPSPLATLAASSTSSNATALISTPDPKPMISPSVRADGMFTATTTAPSTRETEPSMPQKNASAMALRSGQHANFLRAVRS